VLWADRCQRETRTEDEQDVPTSGERKKGEQGQDKGESHGGIVWWCGDENRPRDPFYTFTSNHSGGSQVFDGKKFVENSNQSVLHLEVMVVEFGENMCS
jgi:hypothetical protein